MRKIYFGFLLIFGMMSSAWAQSFTATVNRNPVPEGETFVLTLELKDADTSATPDLSALNQEMTVLSVSNGYRTSIVNGAVSKSRQWNLVLIPNHTGEITIPVLSLDTYQTQPINLTVTPAGAENKLPENPNANASKFKMTGEVATTSPYVQQQLNYQLKLYDAGGLQGNAPYFVTNNDDWVIKSLGEPKVETKIVNGQSLRELTFDYALFAQKSGNLTIPPVRFEGYYLTKSTRKDPFAQFFAEDDFFAGFGLNDIFANKNQVVLNTKPINVAVRPAQTESGWWLPAEEVALSAEFESDKPVFKVGEAVSRTVHVKAVGVLDNQLPEMSFPKANGVKQYPEKPQIEMRVEDGKVVSYAQITNVYIPEQGGEVELPEIRLNWFNTKTNAAETAVVPAYKAFVLGETPQIKQPEQPAAKERTAEKPAAAEPVSASDNIQMIWLLAGAFIGGILITLLLVKLASKFSALPDNRKKMIVAAAEAKDLRALRDALIAWAQETFPERTIVNFQDVTDAFSSEALSKELDKIREALYGSSAASWNEKEFLAVFATVSKKIKKQKRTTHDPLPKLYK